MGDDEKKDDDKKDDDKKEGDDEEDDDPDKDAKKLQAAIDLKNKSRIKHWYELRAEDEKLKEKLKITLQDQQEREQLRRFQIKIWNMRIQNLMGETVDVFIQFTFGGDFRESLIIDKEKFKQKKEHGTLGQYFRTDVADNIDSSQYKSFVLTYFNEVDLCYQQIEDQYLDMEIWKYNTWKFNDFYAHTRVKLSDIAKGEICRSFNFSHPVTEKQTFKFSFNIIFQEIWDFNLKYGDFKGNDVQDSLGQTCNPVLELSLMLDGKLDQKIQTTEKDQDRNPFWGSINDIMQFRGSVADLESQYLEVAFINKTGGFGGDELISKDLLSLKGSCDSGTLKAELSVVVCKKELENKKLDLKQQIVLLKKKAAKTTDDNFEYDDELIKIKKDIEAKSVARKIRVEGKINVGDKPKYSQSGDFTAIKSSNLYLVVHLKRIGKMIPPIDRENYNVFIEIEWNSIKRTKTLNETLTPNFNEIIYFQFPIDIELQKKNPKKFKEWMKQEMQNKFNVRIDLWAEYQGTNENLGSCNIFLEELSSQQRQELDYFYDEEDYNYNYKSRQFVGKKRLVSAFRAQESIIELSAWFMPDIPLTHELKDLPKKITDVFPYEYKELENIVANDELEIYNNWVSCIKSTFSVLQTDFNERRMQRMKEYIFQHDQYKMKHLIVKFMAKISPPQLMNAVNQPKEEEVDEEEVKKKQRRKKKLKAKGIIEEESDEESKKFTMNNSVQCPDEIFHYIRCIPHVENNLQNIWGSPDFLLSAKKGGIFEHCLLMSSLFLGCLNENYDVYKEKAIKQLKKISVVNMTKREQLNAKFEAWDPIGLEHRTFVCVGVLKNTEQEHSWVMTFDKSFKEVTFWECRNGLKYVLKNRIKDEEVVALRSYLCPQHDIYDASKTKAFYDLENTGTEKLKKQVTQCKKAFKKKLRDCIASIKGFIIQEDNFNDNDRQQEKLKQKQDEIIDELEKENINNNDEEDLLIEDEENQEGPKKTKEVALGFNDYDQLMENAKEKAMIFRNRDQGKGGGAMLTRDQIMEEKKRMYDEEQAKRKDRHLLPVLFFDYDEQGNGITDELTCPYESIDLLFNNKNIYLNVKNHDPLRIYFHLHKPDMWMPFLKHEKAFSKKRDLSENDLLNLQDLEDDDDEGRRAIEYDDWKETVYGREAIDPFYRTKNISAPSKLEEIERIENEINKYIKKTIMQIRSALNLQTKYRLSNDFIPQLMGNYLKEMENYQCGRSTAAHFEKKKEKFMNNIKYFLDADYMMESQPFFFNTINQETIKQILQEDPPAFFTVKEKKSIFSTVVQIFPYAQKIYSVRVMIAIFYVKKKDVEEQQQDKKKEKKDKEKTEENEDIEEEEEEELEVK